MSGRCAEVRAREDPDRRARATGASHATPASSKADVLIAIVAAPVSALIRADAGASSTPGSASAPRVGRTAANASGGPVAHARWC